MEVLLIFIICGLPVILLTVELLNFLNTGKRRINKKLYRAIQLISLIIFPLFFLFLLDEKNNNCCGDSAIFSPHHRLTIYTLIGLFISTFFYSNLNKTQKPPLVDVFINSVLLAGIVFNIFLCIQIGNPPIWILGNLPIIIIFIIELIENHFQFIRNQNTASLSNKKWVKLLDKFLRLNLFIKTPILLVFFLPLLILTTNLLRLLGQQPDSLIRAFTDTYYHGFSQLDYMCENVTCGGHYLCSIAANGHEKIVKPVRYGIRRGNRIICNRQLLVSNAFEDLIQEKLPRIHKVIRSNYNSVGYFTHKYYGFFEVKILSDIIYITMKPFELFFITILYLFDTNPENRIEKQYVSKEIKNKIESNKTKYYL